MVVRTRGAFRAAVIASGSEAIQTKGVEAQPGFALSLGRDECSAFTQSYNGPLMLRVCG
jgi:hypothetical protein